MTQNEMIELLQGRIGGLGDLLKCLADVSGNNQPGISGYLSGALELTSELALQCARDIEKLKPIPTA